MKHAKRKPGKKAHKVKPGARGRPRGEKYAGGLSEAAGRLQVSLSLVKMCKAAGCVAFRANGLVHLGELEEYIQSHPELNPAMSDLLNEQKEKTLDKKAIRELREHRLMVARREVVKVSEMRLTFTRAFTQCRKSFGEAMRTLAQETSLHCGATEEQIGWAIQLAAKRTREVLLDVSKGEWCGLKCEKCGHEVK